MSATSGTVAGNRAGAAVAAAAKRTPIRTCVACRTTGGKRGLLRVVRMPGEAGVTLDPTGKKSGRGAYVCPSETCVTQALKRKSLERSLKTPIPESVAEELRRAVVPDEPESAGGPDG